MAAVDAVILGRRADKGQRPIDLVVRAHHDGQNHVPQAILARIPSARLVHSSWCIMYGPTLASGHLLMTCASRGTSLETCSVGLVPASLKVSRTDCGVVCVRQTVNVRNPARRRKSMKRLRRLCLVGMYVGRFSSMMYDRFRRQSPGYLMSVSATGLARCSRVHVELRASAEGMDTACRRKRSKLGRASGRGGLCLMSRGDVSSECTSLDARRYLTVSGCLP